MHLYLHLPSICYDGWLCHGQLFHLCTWSIHIFIQGFCSNIYATPNLQHPYILLHYGVPIRKYFSCKKFQLKNNSHPFCLFFITLIQSTGLLLINYLQHLHHLFYFMQASLSLIFRPHSLLAFFFMKWSLSSFLQISFRHYNSKEPQERVLKSLLFSISILS